MKRKWMQRMMAMVLAVMLALSVPVSTFALTAADFTDVKGHWGYPYIDYVVKRGLMAGKGKGSFDPNGKVTRSQMVQVLYGLEKRPAVDLSENGFSDVSNSQWFAKAVVWAKNQGIASGVKKDRFAPNGLLPRQQVAVMTYQYCKKFIGGDMGLAPESEMAARFPDWGDTASWAEEAMRWAVKSGFMGGTSKGLEPRTITTRAQLAVFLQKLDGMKNSGASTTDPTPSPEPSASPSASPSPSPSPKPMPSLQPAPTDFDSTIPSGRIVVDGQVTDCDINEKDGAWYVSGEDLNQAFDTEVDQDFVGLEDFAQATDIGYEQDEVMDSAYFHTGESYGAGPDDVDFARAIAAGLVPEELQNQPDRQITSTEFKAMLAQAVRQTAPDQLAQLDEYITGYETPLTRGHGFVMAYYGAKCIGADYLNCGMDNVNDESDEFWDAPVEEFKKLMPHAEDGPVKIWWTTLEQEIEWRDDFTTAYLFSFWHLSPVTGELLFSFDEKTGTMRQKDPLTVKEAAAAARRLLESVPGGTAGVADPTVTTADPAILSEKLLEKANSQPKVTAFDHPDWCGFRLPEGKEKNEIFSVSPKDIKQISDWGFNCVLLLVNYETLFNEEVTQGNLQPLQALDALVAAAIEHNVHISLTFLTLPGRRRNIDQETLESIGDFDLFTAPEKQVKADRVFTAIAKRYQEVPNTNFSISPFWEPFNQALSTGLTPPEYTAWDVNRYQTHVVDLIQAIDSDRLIVAESAVCGRDIIALSDGDMSKEAQLFHTEESEYLLFLHNFRESSYVYANMTDEPGRDIDVNNSSMFAPDYPTYTYSCQKNINNDTMLLDGFLPAGTTIDIYIERTGGENMNIMFEADGAELYRERLGQTTYNVTSPHLSGHPPYATSDKKISVVLPKDTKEQKIHAIDGGFDWTGMDVILPEEYAVERWYNVSEYDVIHGLEPEAGTFLRKTSRVMLSPNQNDKGKHITIHEDITYTSEHIAPLNMACAEVIYPFMKEMKAWTPHSIIRYECADFSGKAWYSAASYYEDVLGAMQEAGIGGWLSCDYTALNREGDFVNVEYAARPDGTKVCVELLKLLQKYQPQKSGYRCQA